MVASRPVALVSACILTLPVEAADQPSQKIVSKASPLPPSSGQFSIEASYLYSSAKGDRLPARS